MRNKSPSVGIAILVFKNGRILFGRCRGKWHVPQGILRTKDDSLEAAARQVAKQCGGYDITTPTFLCWKSWFKERPVTKVKHSLYFTAIWRGGNGTDWNIEGVKCDQWDWFDLNLLPHPLFVSTHILDKETLRKIRKVARDSK